MTEHKYISEHLERRTYIKGSFKGKFVGRLDAQKSDAKNERYFDITVQEGEIVTRQDYVTRWMDGSEHEEFADESMFPVKLPGLIDVELQYTDGSVKYFKLGLKEIKLLRCRLSHQQYRLNEVHGIIEGDVSGYVMHKDTIVHEVKEEKKEEKKTKAVDVAEDAERIVIEKPPVVTKPVRTNDRDTTVKPPTGPGCLNAFTLICCILLSIVSMAILPNWGWGLLILFAGVWVLYNLSAFLTRRFRASEKSFFILSGLFFVIYSCFLIQHVVQSQYSTHGLVKSAVATGYTDTKSKKQRADSFAKHLASANKNLQGRHTDQALEDLKSATLYAPVNSSEVDSEAMKLYNSLAKQFEEEKNYKKALEAYSALISLNTAEGSSFYKRAMCYLKLRDVRSAVKDLKKAIELKYTPAYAQHEKINPLKKRVAYTVIRCRDGSISNSKSRTGTCSHHGGVENWEEPVYEEYRQYN